MNKKNMQVKSTSSAYLLGTPEQYQNSLEIEIKRIFMSLLINREIPYLPSLHRSVTHQPVIPQQMKNEFARNQFSSFGSVVELLGG